MADNLLNNFPKLHNAMWPGLVGKGSPGAEPCLDLDTMLDLTAKAEVNGVKFDGVDLFLFDPHVSIDIDDDGLKRLADKIRGRGFVIGSVVAPVWPPTGGGSAMGDAEERKRFTGQVEKACRIARKLTAMGIRPSGVVNARIHDLRVVRVGIRYLDASPQRPFGKIVDPSVQGDPVMHHPVLLFAIIVTVGLHLDFAEDMSELREVVGD